MLSRVPSWVLLIAGLTGVGLTIAYGSIDDPRESQSGLWQLTLLLGLLLMDLALSTYLERRGWNLQAVLRKRRERRERL
jgi:hypothetical protein